MAWSKFRGGNKFGAKRVQYDNFTFASKLEASVYQLLKLDPNIEIVQCQARVKLTKAEIVYIPDFKCLDKTTNETFYVEAKGIEGERYIIIRKLWKFYGECPLIVYKGSHLNPRLYETITPETSSDEVTTNN